MKFEIYGYTKETLNITEWEKKNGEFLGTYDGIEFKSDKYKVEQLEEWDYLHFFIGEQIESHSPKKFNKNILEKLKKRHTREFGEVIQTSLF